MFYWTQYRCHLITLLKQNLCNWVVMVPLKSDTHSAYQMSLEWQQSVTEVIAWSHLVWPLTSAIMSYCPMIKTLRQPWSVLMLHWQCLMSASLSSDLVFPLMASYNLCLTDTNRELDMQGSQCCIIPHNQKDSPIYGSFNTTVPQSNTAVVSKLIAANRLKMIIKFSITMF